MKPAHVNQIGLATFVFASEARQSSAVVGRLDCRVAALLAKTRVVSGLDCFAALSMTGRA